MDMTLQRPTVNSLQDVASPSSELARAIAYRTRGSTRGPITRLMSPSDLGQVVKPFVFLDLVEKEGSPFQGQMHPHSGIATVTHLIEGGLNYIDPDGVSGIMTAGSVEWMKAGRGMWHGGGAEAGRLLAFQLWLALPPELELSPYHSLYVDVDTIESHGPARVLFGRYEGAKDKIDCPLPVTYLAVKLAAGETWHYTPPAGHSVLWIALAAGALQAPDAIAQGEMIVFERSEQGVTFTAKTEAEFVLGSAVPHDHDLALGYYSVHTSPEALEAGEREIATIGQQLKKQGRL
jgi:redox-sensitive bicupin YhaK (pirin superfamily)